MQKFDFQINIGSWRLIPAGIMTVWALQLSLALGSVEMFLESYILLGLVILFVLFAFWICFKDAYMTRFELVVISFLLIIFAASILNGTDFKNWAFSSLSILLPLLLFRYYKDNLPALLIGMLLGLTISMYAGLLDLLAHPEKWFNLERGDPLGYLLGGNYNQIAPIAMTAMAVNLMCLKISRWFWLNFVPLAGVCVAIVVIVNSSTAIAGFALLVLFLLIPSKKLQRLAIYGILVSVVLFEFFVCFQGKGFENNELARWIIIDLLGKDMTFTYRTDMWDSALRIIVQSPIIGFGFPDPEWYRANMSSFAVGPHNAILAFLIYGGIVALGFYIWIFYWVFKRTIPFKDRYANIILGILSILSLMMLFEIYTVPFIITLLVIAYYYPELDKVCKERNNTAQLIK